MINEIYKNLKHEQLALALVNKRYYAIYKKLPKELNYHVKILHKISCIKYYYKYYDKLSKYCYYETLKKLYTKINKPFVEN